MADRSGCDQEGLLARKLGGAPAQRGRVGEGGAGWAESPRRSHHFHRRGARPCAPGRAARGPRIPTPSGSIPGATSPTRTGRTMMIRASAPPARWAVSRWGQPLWRGGPERQRVGVDAESVGEGAIEARVQVSLRTGMGGRTWRQAMTSTGCCAAGRSTMVRGSSVAPSASGSTRTTGSTASGFG